MTPLDRQRWPSNAETQGFRCDRWVWSSILELFSPCLTMFLYYKRNSLSRYGFVHVIGIRGPIVWLFEIAVHVTGIRGPIVWGCNPEFELGMRAIVLLFFKSYLAPLDEKKWSKLFSIFHKFCIYMKHRLISSSM